MRVTWVIRGCGVGGALVSEGTECDTLDNLMRQPCRTTHPVRFLLPPHPPSLPSWPRPLCALPLPTPTCPPLSPHLCRPSQPHTPRPSFPLPPPPNHTPTHPHPQHPPRHTHLRPAPVHGGCRRCRSRPGRPWAAQTWCTRTTPVEETRGGGGGGKAGREGRKGVGGGRVGEWVGGIIGEGQGVGGREGGRGQEGGEWVGVGGGGGSTGEGQGVGGRSDTYSPLPALATHLLLVVVILYCCRCSCRCSLCCCASCGGPPRTDEPQALPLPWPCAPTAPTTHLRPCACCASCNARPFTAIRAATFRRRSPTALHDTTVQNLPANHLLLLLPLPPLS